MFENVFNELDFFFKPKEVELKSDISFSKHRIEFLNKLSINLIKDKSIYKYPDLISLSFWLRKKNITQLIPASNNYGIKTGRGIAFHVTPKNVPTNFAYSFAYSFLSGNANLVRLPSKSFQQVKIICNHIKNTLKEDKFKKFYFSNFFFNYDSSNNDISKKISNFSDVRIIWGGDETVRELKNIITKPKTKDIVFNNKFSAGVISSSKFLKLNKNKKSVIAGKLFNDIYTFDQAACTSPHIIFWHGNEIQNKKARKIMWSFLFDIVSKKYKLDLGSVSKRFFTFVDLALSLKKKEIKSINNMSNKIFRIELKKIDNLIYEKFRGMGIIFEYSSNKIDDLKFINTQKFQTLLYFGFKKDELIKLQENLIINNFDRVVPLGSSMVMNQYWDSYDLFNELTRHIELY